MLYYTVFARVRAYDDMALPCRHIPLLYLCSSDLHPARHGARDPGRPSDRLHVPAPVAEVVLYYNILYYTIITILYNTIQYYSILYCTIAEVVPLDQEAGGVREPVRSVVQDGGDQAGLLHRLADYLPVHGGAHVGPHQEDWFVFVCCLMRLCYCLFQSYWFYSRFSSLSCYALFLIGSHHEEHVVNKC